MSDSLWPHGLQHARLPCPSPTPRVCSNYVHWVSDAIQPSHPPLSPSPPVFNLSQHQGLSHESALNIRWPKYQSFSFSIVLLMNIQGWLPLGLTSWISLQSKGLSRVFSSTTVWKHQFFSAESSLWPLTSTHDYWKNHISDCCCCLVASVVSDIVQPHGLQSSRLLHPWDSPGKNTGVGCHFLLQPLTRHFFVSKLMSLLFNMLSRFVIAFLPRSKGLLISWL